MYRMFGSCFALRAELFHQIESGLLDYKIIYVMTGNIRFRFLWVMMQLKISTFESFINFIKFLKFCHAFFESSLKDLTSIIFHELIVVN